MEAKKDIFDFIKAKNKPELGENYFENFSTEFLNKIKTEIPQTKKTKIIRPTFWLLGLAASLLIYFGISNLLNQNDDFAKVSDSEILAYVEDNIDDFDSESIYKHLEESNFLGDTTKLRQAQFTQDSLQNVKKMEGNKPKIILPTQSSSELFESLSEEDLYNYLNSEETDLEEIEI
ncbi:MAG: hypothetical protein V4622_06080 [Bacteroidota bacterium]